jgi:thiamine-phosphate pyrophosphorylase
MPLQLPLPTFYPITSGRTTAQTTPDDPEFALILELLEACVSTFIPIFQIREKLLSARVLYELTSQAVEITRGSETRVLVNDRADIARAAGADGVHLTSQSLPANVVREMFGPDFVIGVSTHSLDEARAAQLAGADFVVFGPIFETESKRAYGEPQGLEKLAEVAVELQPLPVIAIGGITPENGAHCLVNGASGVAAIRMFDEQLRARE